MTSALLILALSLMPLGTCAFAEPADEIDVVAIVRDMPYEQRMQVAQDILNMIADTNGLEALDKAYQTIRGEYPLVPAANEEVTGDMTPESLDELLATQPLAVTEARFVVQSESYSMIFSDMLTANIVNNSPHDIKDAVVAFVAWDKNGLPVKIKGMFDMVGGMYVKEVRFDDINLVPGDTYGEKSGYSLGSDSGIVTVKAIAISYVTFDGEEWKTPTTIPSARCTRAKSSPPSNSLCIQYAPGRIANLSGASFSSRSSLFLPCAEALPSPQAMKSIIYPSSSDMPPRLSLQKLSTAPMSTSARPRR